MSWQVVANPGQCVVHIIPLGDFEPHDETLSCRCEPQIKPVEDGGRDLAVHQAYDDRSGLEN